MSLLGSVLKYLGQFSLSAAFSFLTGYLLSDEYEFDIFRLL